MTSTAPDARWRFGKIAVAGVTFQAGSAAVDSSTIMAALIFQLTGSSLAVGAVTSILRVGWLFPQLIVGFLAQRRGSSMRYYAIGGFGRAACLAVMAAALFLGSDLPSAVLAGLILVIWTGYSFVSGIVAVPYNDIVARSVPSSRRSRLLATRFFGGGVLALGIVAIAEFLLGELSFAAAYAGIIAMASGLMFLSSVVFVSMGEPAETTQARTPTGFFDYLRDGFAVFRSDRRFRLYVFAQWFSGAVLMAMPFYVVQATSLGFDLARIALLLGAQTAGALISSALWGWWGDRRGKASLLQAVAIGRIVPPVLILSLAWAGRGSEQDMMTAFLVLFFIMGALANGLTIAGIGFLMEISPEDQRPAYSGYFNALTAPAFLFPLLGGAIATWGGLALVFALSLIAAALQSVCIWVLRKGAASSG